MTDLLNSILTPTTISLAVAALMGLVALLVGPSAVRKRRIALATFHGYAIAKDIGDEIPGPDPFDKIAAAMKAADDYMKANGWRPLKPDEKGLVYLGARSLDGQALIAAETKELLGSPQ